MKKALFIMHTPPPVHGASMMGKYIRGSSLINESFECYYIKPSRSESLTDIKKFSFAKITFLFTFHYRLVKLYRNLRPDISYFTANSWGLSFYRDFITVMILKIMGANIILHFHNKPEPSFRNKSFNKFLYRIFFKQLHVIFLADRLVDDFRPYIDKEKTYVCPNGIPLTLSSPAERRSSCTPFTFLFLSNMMAEKGVWVLLEACNILKAKGSEFRCHYVGQWSDITEQMFEQAVSKHDLTNEVKAFGAKYGEEKTDFFQTADVFVFPSFDEALPLTLLEAMEHSLPCIGTNVGGISTIIRDGVSGFLVNPKDATALAEKMIYLMEHPQQAVEMGKAGRKVFEENFTIQKFEDTFFYIIKSVAGSKRKTKQNN